MQLRNPRHRPSSRALAAAAKPVLESLEDRRLMSTTTAPAYLVPTAPGVETRPLLTVGDSVGGYRMAGIPDGLGAYDNGDGTFTVLMNHELRPDRGTVRDHGATGAFVSKWVIDKETLDVLSGDDLIKQVQVWNPATGTYVTGTGLLAQLNRLCSADLPEVTAFYNPASGLGTTDRIFMNGEETNNGRAFATVVSTGIAYELPWTGRYAWENHVASPHPQDKTVVMGLDDSRREFSSEGSTEPAEVYVWVGTKRATGSVIDRAGLGRAGGVLHGMRVGAPGAYDANESTVTSGERFELVALSDQTNNTTFGPLQQESIAKGVTQFRRVEDGHFDPTNRNVFYYVATDQFGGQTRLWKLTFDDIERPELGGTIEIGTDTTPGAPAAGEPLPGEMFDNMTANSNGDLLVQEDPGGNAYLAKVWQIDASTGDRIEVARHNPVLFTDADPSTPGNQYAGDLDPTTPGNQSTIDEESSGVIDLSGILGEGWYLADVQAHYAHPDPELVEAGQLLLINTNAAKATLAGGVLTVNGTVNDDGLAVTRKGQTLTVTFDGRTLGAFDAKAVDVIQLLGFAGDDDLSIGGNVQQPALVDGGLGDDVIAAGNGPSVLIGGMGKDRLSGGPNGDLLTGDAVDGAAVASALGTLAASGKGGGWLQSVQSLFSTTRVDDGKADVLDGRGSRDVLL